MRIIDKNKDFYDYYQDIYRDTSLTFDRTASYTLTKEDLMRWLDARYVKRWVLDDEGYAISYILLQVCNTFWIFSIQPTEVNNGRVKDCDIKLLKTWKNYNQPRCLIKLERVEPKLSFNYISEKDEKKKIDILMQAIATDNYNVRHNYGGLTSYRQHKSDWIEETKHIPLLKASGLSSFINPLDIYTAFEEYFSLEKSASERRESVGITDKEKVENHGFDSTISFRGKDNKKNIAG